MITLGDTEVYNISEISELLHLSKDVVRRYCGNGTIKARKIGRAWHATKENLQRYLQSVEVEDNGV